MRKFVLIAALVSFTAPAFADSDSDFKALVEAHVKKYIDAFNAKSVDGIMATYAPDGIFLAADGHTEQGDVSRKTLEATLASGLHEEATVTEAHRYGNAGFAIGTYTITMPGKDFKAGGNWNAAYEINGDKIATKLLAASVPPPPPKQ